MRVLIVVVALVGCPARTPAGSGDATSAGAANATQTEGSDMIVTVRTKADLIEVQKAYGTAAYGGGTEPTTLTIRVEGAVQGGTLDLDGMGTTPVSVVVEGMPGAHFDGTRVTLRGPSVSVAGVVFDRGGRLSISASESVSLDRVALIATQPADMPGDALLSIDATGPGSELRMSDSWVLGATSGSVATVVMRSPTGGGFAAQTLRNVVLVGSGDAATLVHGLPGTLTWTGGLVARDGPPYQAEVPTAHLAATDVAGLEGDIPVAVTLKAALKAARAGAAPDVAALRAVSGG